MPIDKIWTWPYQPLGDLMLDHFQHLTEETGLRPEILEAARPFSLRGRFVRECGLRNDILDRLNLPRGYEHDLLIFPYPGYGDVFRARLDVPEHDKDGREIKYKQPAKQRNAPYVIKPFERKYPSLFVTEGEKKTLALVQAGCDVLGLGGVWNWRDKASPTGVIPDLETYDFKGRVVAVIFDSDVQSNRQVQQAEEQLVNFFLDRGASQVLRIRLPNSVDRKIGIDDFLKDEGEPVLDRLLEQALIERGFLSGADIMAGSYAPTKMLTQFLPDRGLILIAGVPGAGKTEFLISQALQIGAQGDVLYFLNEGGRFNLQVRQNAYCRDREIVQRIKWGPWRNLNFSRPEGLIRLERMLQTFRPLAVILDPGPDAFEEENDAATLKEPLRRLYHLTELYQVCLVLSWHFSKMPSFSGVYSFRGSSAIAGKVDLVYDLTLTGGQRILKLDKMRLDCEGLKQGQRWIIAMETTETGRVLQFIDVAAQAAAKEEKKQAMLTHVLDQLQPDEVYVAPWLIEAIMKGSEAPISADTARRYLKEWVKQGFLEVAEPARGKKPAKYQRTEKELKRGTE